jgi:phosphate transport system permease protein
MAVVPQEVRRRSLLLALSRGRRERALDPLFRGVVTALGVLVLVVLGLMIVKTAQTAWPALSSKLGELVTGTHWAPSRAVYGALPFIYGTLVASAVAFVLAAPISIGIALYLNEVAPKRLRLPLAYMIEALAAVPSVVFGLWGVLVLVPALNTYAWEPISSVLGWIPIFAGPSATRSFASAGVVLAIMIIPIMTAISREVIAVVPRDLKEASLALGATRWEMIRTAILPFARSGLVGAMMLGFGRAVGETIAVALVIGSVPQIVASLFKPGYTMASVIANEFPEATGFHTDALIAVGVLLFAITIVINVAARLLVRRAERRLRAA